MPLDNHPTASMIVIGNEILSGRTQEANLNYIAKGLTANGIKLAEGRIIADIEDEIVATVNHCRARYDYVFTSGGIGPTHDDITAAAIARAFGKAFISHPEAESILRDYYGDALTEARLRMALMPEDAVLIPNPVSSAPGFSVENVYVLAGVPSIMQAMFDWLLPQLKGGDVIHSTTISAQVPESRVADAVAAIQQRFAEVDIGSYPQIKNGTFGVSIVARCSDTDLLGQVADEITLALQDHTDQVKVGEL